MGFLQFTLDHAEKIQRLYELSNMPTGIQLAEKLHKHHLEFLRKQRDRLEFTLMRCGLARESYFDQQEEILQDCELRWDKMDESERRGQDGKVLKVLIETMEKDMAKLKTGENELEVKIKKEKEDLDKMITSLEKSNHGLAVFKVSS